MEKSCPYRAWQNGLVERCNRSVTTVAKTLMQQSNLPAEFWAHAVCTAAYILNRLSHRRLEGKITPYERVFGQRPNLKNLQVFGCHAEILIEKQYRRKDLADSASESAIFIDIAGSLPAMSFMCLKITPLSHGVMPCLTRHTTPREWGIVCL